MTSKCSTLKIFKPETRKLLLVVRETYVLNISNSDNAKQSGYFFQLYRGRVNWTEIENLCIEDLIKDRDFHLLEQNLINVINCDLEREYDLKILDQKFVKLFKLAQLGVDYLSYCEMYLDQCVVFLQEQLIANQEELEIFKQEKQKMSEELKKIKKKNKIQNYQCEKCEKVFISEVYLKFHDKRRHSNPTTPKSLDSLRKCADSSQQTENRNKFNASTQTLNSKKETMTAPEIEEVNEIKNENDTKIRHFEKELEELKIRLLKAESSLTEKNEALKQNHSSNLNYPAPIFYPPLLPFVPSYIPQPRNYFEVNPGYQMPAPEGAQAVSSSMFETTDVEVIQTKSLPHISSRVEVQEKKSKELATVKNNENNSFNATFNRQKKKISKRNDNEKENIDPKAFPETEKPQPLPRRTKQIFENQTTNKEKTPVTDFFTTDIQPKSNFISFNEHLITRSSTPIRDTQESENTPKRLEENFNEKDTRSKESLISEDLTQSEQKSKSIIKKIVSHKSPTLQGLSKNVKRSLATLSNSVSLSGGQDSWKLDKSICENSKETPVEGLNDCLRELGVDPEWRGIPKKTLRQKLNALKHRRKLLAKDNPSFPSIRQNIEKNILKKLNNKFFNFGITKSISNQKTNEQESVETQESQDLRKSQETTSADQKTEEIPCFKKSVMYNIDSDSETDISSLIPREFPIQKDIISIKSESEEDKSIEKAFDFSVFQVGKKNLGNEEVENKAKKVSLDELHTDSDFEGDFLFEYDQSLKNSGDCSHSKPKTVKEENDKISSEETEIEELKFWEVEKDKTEKQSILKSTSLKPQAKKKVLFLDYLKEDDNKSNERDQTNDEVWSLKSS